MGKRDPRIDAYIARSAPFARPILAYLRALVHRYCPEADETMKRGIPHFIYGDVLCLMAAEKQHCSFGFAHRAMRRQLDRDKTSGPLGQFGRIWARTDLPSEQKLSQLIVQAAEHNAKSAKIVRVKPPRRVIRPPKPPADLLAALQKNIKARTTFAKFSDQDKRDYIEWLEETRRPQTRDKRLATIVKWLAQGKKRHWKYRP